MDTWFQWAFFLFGCALALGFVGLLAFGAFGLVLRGWDRLTRSECPHCGRKL